MASCEATKPEFDWSGFSEIGQKMYLNEKTADVFFIVDDGNGGTESIPAHKSLLAAGSDVFHRMFYEDQSNVKNVRVTEGTAPALKEFLRCFYTNNVELSIGNAHEVMRLSDKYQVQECKAACNELMRRSPTVDTVCHIYSQAIQSKQTQLKMTCEQFIDQNIQQVFQSQGFLSCDKATLDNILKRDDLSCPETAVFEAYMAWVKHASKQQNVTKELVQTHLGKSFYEIRFRSMTNDEFTSLLPSYAQVFSGDELSEIFQMIVNEQFKPKLFNGKRRKEQASRKEKCTPSILWQKESNKPNAKYVDIFAMTPNLLHSSYALLMEQNKKIPSKCEPKCERIAIEKRAQGNTEYAISNWTSAMLHYNDSLRYAKPGSKNISLAYANRSSCFLNMKMYEKCLVDIELAKGAGYPAELLPKLERRRIDCLKKMEEDPKRDVVGLKLSHEPNEKFPFVANVVTFKRDAKGECSAFAKEDIDVGQTIGVEEPYLGSVHQDFGSVCNICLKGKTNLIPCDKCPLAMFCSKECQQCSLHGYECGSILIGLPELDLSVITTTRPIFKGMDLFSTATEFIDFVEQSQLKEKHVSPDNYAFSDEKSMYLAYIQNTLSRKEASYGVMLGTYMVYKFLLSHSKIKSFFQTEQQRRFLMHFTLMIGLIPMISHYAPPEFHAFMSQDIESQVVLYSYSSFTRRYFKHSCAPNIILSDPDGRSFFTTVRPVKKGEQLWSGKPEILLDPKDIRQRTLMESTGSIEKCKCSRCKGVEATMEQRLVLAEDPIFTNILLQSQLESEYNTNMKRLAEQCATFLQRYRNIDWCYEIGLAVHIFTHVLELKLAIGYNKTI